MPIPSKKPKTIITIQLPNDILAYIDAKAEQIGSQRPVAIATLIAEARKNEEINQAFLKLVQTSPQTLKDYKKV